MTTVTSTTNSSTQLRTVAANTSQTASKTGSTQALDNSAVKVQISDRGRQAMANPNEKAVKATSNLEKEANKLAERAASKDISDSERQKLGAALQSINGAIKGLGGKQVSIDAYRKQDTGTTATKDTTSAPASGDSATPTKPQTTPAKPSALAVAAEKTIRKNDAASATLNNLAKVYGGGSETANGRLNLVA